MFVFNKQVAVMNEDRSCAACVVFEENIVICGGYNSARALDTVASYDVLSRNFCSMPNTINERVEHFLVVAKRKLFVVGDMVSGCEVFDKANNKFVFINKYLHMLIVKAAVSIGNKIYMFSQGLDYVACYDVEKNEYTYEKCKLTEKNFSIYLFKITLLLIKTC